MKRLCVVICLATGLGGYLFGPAALMAEAAQLQVRQFIQCNPPPAHHQRKRRGSDRLERECTAMSKRSALRN